MHVVKWSINVVLPSLSECPDEIINVVMVRTRDDIRQLYIDVRLVIVTLDIVTTDSRRTPSSRTDCHVLLSRASVAAAADAATAAEIVKLIWATTQLCGISAALRRSRPPPETACNKRDAQCGCSSREEGQERRWVAGLEGCEDNRRCLMSTAA